MNSATEMGDMSDIVFSRSFYWKVLGAELKKSRRNEASFTYKLRGREREYARAQCMLPIRDAGHILPLKGLEPELEIFRECRMRRILLTRGRMLWHDIGTRMVQ